MRVFLQGLLTGLVLQVAIGPVFFFLANIAIQQSLPDAFYAVLGVTLADYIYIVLAIAGAGRLLEREKPRKILSYVSSVVLIVFGVYMISGVLGADAVRVPEAACGSLKKETPARCPG